MSKGRALNRVHNSRWPLDRLQYVFALCDPVTFTFDLSTPRNNIACRCTSFEHTLGSFVFELSCGQTDAQTDADEHFTPATVVGVSN